MTVAQIIMQIARHRVRELNQTMRAIAAAHAADAKRRKAK